MIAPSQPRAAIESPEWWLARLGARLDARRHRLEVFDNYYNGIQPLAFMTSTERDKFLARFPSTFAANFMALVVDAERERLIVQGFRFGPDKASDDDAWRFWQDNELDGESQIAHTESLVKGVSYALVWPYPEGVTVTIEDPLETIVETYHGNRRSRRAALKLWVDDDDHLLATLYLPDALYKYRSASKQADFPLSEWLNPRRWEQRDVDGEPWPLPNPIGVVPVVPIVNRPRLTGDGQSEISTVMSMQDVINKLRADALTASEFGAYPQRYAIWLPLPVNSETNEPYLPFKPGQDRVWVAPPPSGEDGPPDPGTRPEFGQFAPTSLEGFYSAIEHEIQGIASASRTPYHYFLQHGGQPPSGESLRSAETGLVKKVRAYQLHAGEAWEEVVRLQFLFRDDARGKIKDSETIWQDPESRTESEHVDALTKLKTLGVPDEQLWSDAGYSPQMIARFRRDRAASALLGALAAPPAAVIPPPARTNGTAPA